MLFGFTLPHRILWLETPCGTVLTGSKKFGITEIDTLNDVTNSTEKQTLLTIPYLKYSDIELKQIKQFVVTGNTLVIMDDFGYGNSVLQDLNIQARFSNEILLDPLFSYKNPIIPNITDFSPDLAAAGIKSLTLNHATAITGAPAADILARSSEYSYLDTNVNNKNDTAEVKGPLAIAAAVPAGNGVVILISDPSIIINSMADMNDNDAFMNYIFAHYGNGAPISLDRSHISKSPLDSSKIRLAKIRQILYNPFVIIGITALIFGIVTLYIRKKEAAAIG